MPSFSSKHSRAPGSLLGLRWVRASRDWPANAAYAMCDRGSEGIEPTTSRSRSAYHATIDQAPRHIMAARDAGAHAAPVLRTLPPRFGEDVDGCSETTLRPIGLPMCLLRALLCAFALKQACQVGACSGNFSNGHKELSPSVVVHSHGGV